MRKPWFILSPCGTSLWTNAANDVERKALFRFTNCVTREQVPEVERALLDALLERVRSKMELATETEAAKASAELNGILKLYDGKIEAGQDYHVLLHTDTWLGAEAAKLVSNWLASRGVHAELYGQKDLRTDNLTGFQLALSEIVVWCHERLPGYRERQYRIIFNLTGGFKSVLTFLQVLALFYADESVYTFEGEQLLRIPRLPVRLSADDTVRDNLTLLRRLGMNLGASDPGSIPETMLLQLDGEVCLSEWGRIIWVDSQKAAYSKELLPSPSVRIEYGPKFESSVRGLPPDRMYHINDKIDRLMAHLETGQQPLQSLSFKPLEGSPMGSATHEFYAWSDRDARRVYCFYREDGKTLVLDQLGPHL